MYIYIIIYKSRWIYILLWRYSTPKSGIPFELLTFFKLPFPKLLRWKGLTTRHEDGQRTSGKPSDIQWTPLVDGELNELNVQCNIPMRVSIYSKCHSIWYVDVKSIYNYERYIYININTYMCTCIKQPSLLQQYKIYVHVTVYIW